MKTLVKKSIDYSIYEIAIKDELGVKCSVTRGINYINDKKECVITLNEEFLLEVVANAKTYFVGTTKKEVETLINTSIKNFVDGIRKEIEKAGFIL